METNNIPALVRAIDKKIPLKKKDIGLYVFRFETERMTGLKVSSSARISSMSRMISRRLNTAIGGRTHGLR